MILQHDKSADLVRQFTEVQKSINGQSPDWLNELRQQGLARFSELGIPSVKDEEWKYTNLTPLTTLDYEAGTSSKISGLGNYEGYISKDEINIVFINGTFSKELSNLQGIADGIKISTIQKAAGDNRSDIQSLLSKCDTKNDTAFVALNRALNNDGTYIKVAEKAVFKGLIHIVHITDAKAKPTISAPYTLLSIGKSSESTILESHLALNDQMVYLTNALTDVFVEENAVVHYCKSQKESLSAFHIGQTRVWQERNSNFDGFSFIAGGKLTRNDLNIIIDGEGANANLNALYSVYGDQHVDNHTSVDHRVPNCTSNQLYKGILNGSSRAVFNGKIFVRPIAQLTNSYQLNKNLLLGKDCRVDTKPQLEIFADDVKCTHGATIGQLEEDEMFYLQTRCISRREATQMLVHGFVNDLLSTIKSEDIRKKLNILMRPSFEALS